MVFRRDAHTKLAVVCSVIRADTMVDDSLYDDALDAFDEYDIEYEEV